MTSVVRPFDLRPALRRAFAINGPLTIVAGLFALGFLGTLAGVALDRRVITGAPAWMKPAKFMISSAIYAGTLIWMLGFVRGKRRLVNAATWISVVALVIENALIALQVVRGASSHFNFLTPLDSAITGVMGGLTAGLWTGCFLVGLALLRQRLPDPAIAWSLRLGVLLALVGMTAAFLMVTPTTAQLTAAKAGAGMPYIGAHTVGRADGGPGLPFLGWSTVAGDLRVAHFVGLHGLQVLPLVAFFLNWRLRQRRPGTRTALVVLAGLAYLGLDLLLVWQALRGQSVVRPDATTLGAIALLAIVTALAMGGVLRRDRAVAPSVGDTAPAPAELALTAR